MIPILSVLFGDSFPKRSSTEDVTALLAHDEQGVPGSIASRFCVFSREQHTAVESLEIDFLVAPEPFVHFCSDFFVMFSRGPDLSPDCLIVFSYTVGYPGSIASIMTSVTLQI